MADSWYVVHCEAHHDRQVGKLIASTVPEVFAPRLPKTRRRNGEKPLFPGYLFVRLDLASGIWGTLRYLPGVHRLIEMGGAPCPLDGGIVETIRRRVAEYTRAEIGFRPGDRVTVANGSFADLEGIVCETLSSDQRVAILIDMMRRQVRVELGADEIHPGGRGMVA